MSADRLPHADPKWGALTPLAAGIAAILVFVIFVVFWAEQRLISGALSAQGTLLVRPGEAQDAAAGGVSVQVRLDPSVAGRVAEGQDAVLSLRCSPEVPTLELLAEVAAITRTPTDATLLVKPQPQEWPRIHGLPLLHGSPVEVSIRTGERSVLRLLLDPVIAVFSGGSGSASTNGT